MSIHIQCDISGDTFTVAAFQYMLEELFTDSSDKIDEVKRTDNTGNTGFFRASLKRVDFSTFEQWTFMFAKYYSTHFVSPTTLNIEGSQHGLFDNIFELHFSEGNVIEKYLYLADMEDELMDEDTDEDGSEYEEVLNEAYVRLSEMEGNIIQELEYSPDDYDCIQKTLNEYYEIFNRVDKYCNAFIDALIMDVYIRNCTKDGVDNLKCETALPTVDMYKQQVFEFNNQKHKKGEDIELGQREFPLYDSEWVLTKSLKYANQFQRLFNLLMLRSFKQSIESKKAVYITETVKASLLGGTLTKTISARETDEIVYLVHIIYEP